MSKRALQVIDQDKFRDAHASIKAMRQKIADSKVALDRWDSTKNDVALKAAENKWINRTKGNVFRAWYRAVITIRREREEHRINPPKKEKVDNGDENFKKYTSMLDLVHNMKTRCGDATHLLEINHGLENGVSKQNDSKYLERQKHIDRNEKESTFRNKSCQESPEHNHHDKFTPDNVRELSPLSQLSQRVYRETRQRDIELQNTYHLPLRHFESPSFPKTPSTSVSKYEYSRTSSPGYSGRQTNKDRHYHHYNKESSPLYHQQEHRHQYHSPHKSPVSTHLNGLTPQPASFTTTIRHPTTVKRAASPLSRTNPISVKFYKPVSSPDRSIPTWLQYKHQEFY